MTFEALLSFPGITVALAGLAGSGLTAALVWYKGTSLYPAIQEFKKVRAEFEEMAADGQFDDQEVARIVDYTKGLFARIGERVK